jgi:protein O-mannosyl-transferase
VSSIEYSMKFSSLSKSSQWFVPLVLVFFTLLIYAPGLSGDFEFDDSVNILENSAIKIETLSRDGILAAALSGKSGPLGRSISMLSFAGNYYLTEFEPFFFKLTNVLIHIFAGLGVYAFIRQLALALDKAVDVSKFRRASAVALTTASIWLVHPLNVTSVLYVVQRMTSLSALFTFWALAIYVLGRRKSLAGERTRGLLLIVAGLGPVSVLAALSKENGVLAPYLMLTIELIVFRFVSSHNGTRYFLYLVFSALVLFPIMIVGFNFERFTSYVASGYLQREFSLVDRLVTQPRVLLFYLKLLLFPKTSLMGIYHDDFPVSSSVTESFSTVFSIGAITVIGAIGVFTIRRAPALALGVFWFFIGHSLESTFLPLEMVHEHRNYLPIVGPIFAAAYYFWHADSDSIASRVRWCTVVAALAVLSVVTHGRSVEWSNLVDHAAVEVHNHPNSERANYSMGRVYAMLYNNEKQMDFAKLSDQYFARAAELSRSSVYPITARLQLAYKARVEPPPGLVDAAKQRLQYGRSWDANVVALNNLVNCQMTQYCRLADADVIGLLLAALANPDASRKTRGTANSLLGGYYAVKLDNLELGIPHIKAAVEAEPDRIEYRFDLVRLYGVTDNLAAAQAELATIRKLDTWGLQKERLIAETALLEAALNARAK